MKTETEVKAMLKAAEKELKRVKREFMKHDNVDDMHEIPIYTREVEVLKEILDIKEKAVLIKKIPPVIVSSSSGDWHGLYVNGMLMHEDHQLSRKIVNGYVGAEEVQEREAADNWVEDRGSLPYLLKDVKF